jgi:hypothetical protein
MATRLRVRRENKDNNICIASIAALLGVVARGPCAQQPTSRMGIETKNTGILGYGGSKLPLRRWVRGESQGSVRLDRPILELHGIQPYNKGLKGALGSEHVRNQRARCCADFSGFVTKTIRE